jgi:hypothetical protein
LEKGLVNNKRNRKIIEKEMKDKSENAKDKIQDDE